MKAQLTEDYLFEQPAISWLKDLGYFLYLWLRIKSGKLITASYR